MSLLFVHVFAISNLNAQELVSSFEPVVQAEPPIDPNEDISSADGGLPIRVYLDDQLLTQTSNPAAVSQAEEWEPELSTEVMDLSLNVQRLTVQRNMSVVVFQKQNQGNEKKRKEFNFNADWNYDAFVERAEIRIYPEDQFGRGEPLKILKIRRNKPVVWRTAKKEAERYNFALRLYGKSGGFDQNRAAVIDDELRQAEDGDLWRERLLGEAQMSDVGIEIFGAQVAVQLTKVPEGHRVLVNKRPIPVRFGLARTELALPPGEHKIKVQVADANGQGVRFERKAFVPENKVFYAALGDLTLGAKTGRDLANFVSVEDQTSGEIDLFDSIGLRGQISMYLKGRVLGKYILSAALDTGEGRFDELFSNIVARDPNAIITQIDPDQTYSVYGDDSLVTDEAPSAEKLFIKLERGENHVLWGSFRTEIRGNTFATIERSVYGAQVNLSKQIQTDIGTSYLDFTGFAIPPGHLQQIDKLPGNNGFIYDLSRQNISSRTESIRVVVEEALTGLPLAERTLFPGLDYDIDYLEGKVFLRSKLPEFQDTEGILGSNDAFLDRVFLIVTYEYQAIDAEVDDYVAGGRGALTIGNFLSVGATGLLDGSGVVNQSLVGLDAQANFGQQSYVKAQIAKTNTVGEGEILSGGSVGLTDSKEAVGWRGEFFTTLDELGLPSTGSSISGSIQQRDQGFAAPGQFSFNSERVFNLNVFAPAFDNKLRATGDFSGRNDLTNDINTQKLSLDAEYDLTDKLTAGLVLKNLASEDFTGKKNRSDIGAAIDYRFSEKIKLGGFVQSTLSASPETLSETLIGVRTEIDVSDSVKLKAEASRSNWGMEGRIQADYTSQSGNSFFASYETGANPENDLDLEERDGPRRGLASFGARFALDEKTDVYGEGRIEHGAADPLIPTEVDGIQSVSQTAGIDWRPNDKWRLGLSGDLRLKRDQIYDFMDFADPNDDAYVERTYIERATARLTADYTGAKVRSSASAEFRRELAFDGDHNDTFETAGNLSFDYNPNWKLYAKLNTVLKRNSGGFGDANFVKVDVGTAYRPVDNDRFASIFNYKALYDLPDGEPEEGAIQNIAEYKQRSHILSADLSYAFTPQLTLGAKYGVKWGQVTSSRTTSDWDSSTVHLMVGRADFNFAKDWDALVEGRLMSLSEGNSTRVGALAAIYRHFGKNLKVGVGYSFASVSDDLTNINAASDGFFVNAISKF